jgi:hypothetical protein
MAIFEAITNDARQRAKVQCEVLEIGRGSGANTSIVRLIGRVLDNKPEFGGDSESSSWNVKLDGIQRGSGSIAYDFSGDSGKVYTLFDQEFQIVHNSDGTKTVSASVFFNGNPGTVGNATASGNLVLTDLLNLPLIASAPSLIRTLDRTQLIIRSAVSKGFGTGLFYEYQTSSNNGTSWGTILRMSTIEHTIGLSQFSTLLVRTRGVDSEGAGNWSPSSLTLGYTLTPTINVSRSGLTYTITGSSTGSVTDYRFEVRSSTDGGTIYSGFVESAILPPLGSYPSKSYSYTFTSSPGTSYIFRVRASYTDPFGTLNFTNYITSQTVHTPTVPTIPETAVSLSRSVRDVTIDWESFLTNTNEIAVYNGAIINSYDIEERYSSDGGATWIADYTNITNTPFSTTVFLANNRLIAKTYQFRIKAVSDVGSSAYQESATIFISAYGSRSNGTSFVPIETAKIFLGIGQPGTDENGWKAVENVKRFVGVGQPGADASGWTDLQT